MMFAKIAKMRSDTLLQKYLPSIISDFGYFPKIGKHYLYAKGKIPILLVAHVDTVFAKPPQKIFFDRKYRVFFSPDGLGADDRAGVFGIIKIISRGFRPYLLFTDLEESGAIGAHNFVNREKPEFNAIFALDRKGENEAAIYNCDSEELNEILNEYGFKIVTGSFSDISVICPKFGIAGANLSAGFYENHTRYEYFDENALTKTIEKLSAILENPPEKPILYVPKPIPVFRCKSWENLEKCALCGEEAELYELDGEKICAICFYYIEKRWPEKCEKVDYKRKNANLDYYFDEWWES